MSDDDPVFDYIDRLNEEKIEKRREERKKQSSLLQSFGNYIGNRWKNRTAVAGDDNDKDPILEKMLAKFDDIMEDIGVPNGAPDESENLSEQMSRFDSVYRDICDYLLDNYSKKAIEEKMDVLREKKEETYKTFSGAKHSINLQAPWAARPRVSAAGDRVHELKRIVRDIAYK